MAAPTQAEIDDLETAINSGVLSVRHKDGHSITYRTLAEMKAALSRMKAALVSRQRPTMALVRMRRDRSRG